MRAHERFFQAMPVNVLQRLCRSGGLFRFLEAPPPVRYIKTAARVLTQRDVPQPRQSRVNIFKPALTNLPAAKVPGGGFAKASLFLNEN
jgi:hypothetical protein